MKTVELLIKHVVNSLLLLYYGFQIVFIPLIKTITFNWNKRNDYNFKYLFSLSLNLIIPAGFNIIL